MICEQQKWTTLLAINITTWATTWAHAVRISVKQVLGRLLT